MANTAKHQQWVNQRLNVVREFTGQPLELPYKFAFYRKCQIKSWLGHLTVCAYGDEGRTVALNLKEGETAMQAKTNVKAGDLSVNF